MISRIQFSCQVCASVTFEGEEYHRVTTNKGTFKLCIMCSISAEKLGWDLE